MFGPYGFGNAVLNSAVSISGFNYQPPAAKPVAGIPERVCENGHKFFCRKKDFACPTCGEPLDACTGKASTLPEGI